MEGRQTIVNLSVITQANNIRIVSRSGARILINFIMS